MYWNLYGVAMQQKFLMDGFKWRKGKITFNIEFIHNHDEDSEKEYILKADVNYPKKRSKSHSDLLFLLERMKIDKCSN